MIEELMIGQVVLVPALVGVLEALKRVGLPTKLIPIFALIFGVIAGFSFNSFDMSNMDIIINSIFTGLAIGLSSIGLYSGTKNTIAKK